MITFLSLSECSGLVPEYNHLFTLLDTFHVIPLDVPSILFILTLHVQPINLLIGRFVFSPTLILDFALEPQSDSHRRAPRIPTNALEFQKLMAMLIPTPRISNPRTQLKRNWGVSYRSPAGYNF